MKICIDPGHGGHDSGAVGPTGLNEASVALAISQCLATELEALDVSIRLTRSTDVYVALASRCAIANDWNADWFISVHLNSDGASANGIETLYKTNTGKTLATPVQKALVAATGDRDRGLVFRDDLYVLNATKMPAILCEVGFISNPTFEAKFKTVEYQTLIAEAICAGVAEFFNIPLVPQPPPPGVQAVVTIRISAPTGVLVNVIEENG